MKPFAIAVSFGLLLSFSGCGLFSDPGLEYNYFKSYITYDLSPTNDTLRIGVDTIWLSCTFSDMFFDLNSKKRVTYSNGLEFFIGLEQVKFGLFHEPALDIGADYQPMKFDIVPLTGEAGRAEVGCVIYPAFLNGMYSLKIGIIPKEEGLFFLEDVAGKPTTAGLRMILYQSFNVADCHVDLIPDSFPKVQDMVKSYVDNPNFVVKNRMYCFYVKK